MVDPAVAALVGAIGGATVAGIVAVTTETVRQRHVERMALVEREAETEREHRDRTFAAYRKAARAMGRIRRLTFRPDSSAEEINDLWQEIALDLSELFIVSSSERVWAAAGDFIGCTEDLLKFDLGRRDAPSAERDTLLEAQLNAVIEFEVAMRDDLRPAVAPDPHSVGLSLQTPRGDP